MRGTFCGSHFSERERERVMEGEKEREGGKERKRERDHVTGTHLKLHPIEGGTRVWVKSSLLAKISPPWMFAALGKWCSVNTQTCYFVALIMI